MSARGIGFLAHRFVTLPDSAGNSLQGRLRFLTWAKWFLNLFLSKLTAHLALAPSFSDRAAADSEGEERLLMIDARWLDADAAADYLSLRLDAFYRAVRAGRIPPPSRHLGERTPRWDRGALDAVMISAGTASTDTQTAVDALVEKINAGAFAKRRRKGQPSG